MPPEPVRISSNGQVSIPARVRRRWGVREVLVTDKGDRVVVRPITPDLPGSLVGKYRGLLPASEALRAAARDEEERAADRRR